MIHNARQSTAYHEAGHAVIALHFGCRVASVDIQRTGDRLGVCCYCPPTAPLPKLAILFSGSESEHQLAWCRGKQHLQGIGSDVRAIAQVLIDHELEADDPIVAEARAMVRKLVGVNWSAISRLAEWLIAREVASGKLAMAIFCSQMVSKREREVAV